MTDVAPDASSAQQPIQPQIRVVAQYLRDLSFENPRAPDSLRATDGQPTLDVGVELGARGRPDGLFESDLKLTCTAKVGDMTTFHVEVLYGGLFELANVPAEIIEPVLMIECPRLLFPFVRRIISDATADGGFPPFQMDNIDFNLVYETQRAQRGGEGLVLQ